MGKYSIVGKEKVTVGGQEYELYRIMAEKAFHGVNAGDLGGLISSYKCLSQEGEGWIFPGSIVINSDIQGKARVIRSTVISSHITAPVNIKNSKITNCRINNKGSIQINDCSFKNCTINKDYSVSFTDCNLKNEHYFVGHHYAKINSPIRNDTFFETEHFAIHSYNNKIEVTKDYEMFSSNVIDRLKDNINFRHYFLSKVGEIPIKAMKILDIIIDELGSPEPKVNIRAGGRYKFVEKSGFTFYSIVYSVYIGDGKTYIEVDDPLSFDDKHTTICVEDTLISITPSED